MQKCFQNNNLQRQYYYSNISNMVEYLFDLPDPILETLDSYMSLAEKEENVKGK